MFGLNDGMRYYVCQRYVRMNLGINGLYKLVSQEMDLPPLSGAVFIFFLKKPTAGKTPSLGYGRFHTVSETT